MIANRIEPLVICMIHEFRIASKMMSQKSCLKNVLKNTHANNASYVITLMLGYT
jgi:hypothetical protein